MQRRLFRSFGAVVDAVVTLYYPLYPPPFPSRSLYLSLSVNGSVVLMRETRTH